MKLGVCTLCMPEYEPLEALEALAEWGFDGVSWRVTDDQGDKRNPGFWSGNRSTMTAQEVIERADELKVAAQKTGVQMVSLASYCNPDELADIELTMKAAAAIGAERIRVYSDRYARDAAPYPEQVRRLKGHWAEVAKLAERSGIRACVETHHGQLTPSMSKAMAIMDGLDPQQVGILWDPDNQLREGGEIYTMAVQIAGPYLAEVHAKNSLWVQAGSDYSQALWKTECCRLNEGLVNWPEVIDTLKGAGYDGWICFEDVSDAPTETKLRQDLDWFRQLIG